MVHNTSKSTICEYGKLEISLLKFTSQKSLCVLFLASAKLEMKHAVDFYSTNEETGSQFYARPQSHYSSLFNREEIFTVSREGTSRKV